MFSSLSRGSIIQGVDRTDEMKWFTGSVESVVPSMNNQFPYVNVDIIVNVDGKQRQFRGVHNNESIADFGSDSVIISDNKDTLYNYVKSLLKISEDAVNPDNIKKHEKWIPQYKSVLSEMFPGSTSSDEVKELKNEVSSLKAKLAEAITLLKQGNSKT
jgi:hypothetical protein